MKRFLCAVSAITVLIVSTATPASAQTSSITRAQVRADLIQLERAGYHPASKGLHYPADIQAAEAEIHGENTSNAYGGVSAGTANSGSAPNLDPLGGARLYGHH
jgi:hypothetical protein